MYKQDLTLNTLQWLICYKTQPKPTQVLLSNLNNSILPIDGTLILLWVKVDLRVMVMKGYSTFHKAVLPLDAVLCHTQDIKTLNNEHKLLKEVCVLSVTYWPSTELSIKRCTCVNNRCIWSKTSGYHLDLWTGWIRCNYNAHKKQVGVKQLYNPVPQTVWGSWSQLQLEFESQFEAVRTSSRQRACSPQWPLVEQPSRMRKKCSYSQRNLGSIYCSLFRLQLTSHTQPFRNLSRIECERYIFLKKCLRSFIIVDYVSACICLRIVVSYGYATFLSLDKTKSFIVIHGIENK